MGRHEPHAGESLISKLGTIKIRNSISPPPGKNNQVGTYPRTNKKHQYQKSTRMKWGKPKNHQGSYKRKQPTFSGITYLTLYR